MGYLGSDGELTHIQGFYAGFLWTYFSFYTICGFLVHEWNIQVKTIIDASYVSLFTITLAGVSHVDAHVLTQLPI